MRFIVRQQAATARMKLRVELRLGADARAAADAAAAAAAAPPGGGGCMPEM